jgi:hypothetical protein
LAHGRLNPHRAVGSVKLNSTISPKGASNGGMAAIPDSLISTVRPFSTPQVRDRMLISTSIFCVRSEVLQVALEKGRKVYFKNVPRLIYGTIVHAEDEGRSRP